MSSTISLDELPYSPNSAKLFECIRNMPGAAFIDSAFPHSSSGRFDILTACPLAVNLPTLAVGSSQSESREFFTRLSTLQREFYGDIQAVTQDIPFCGGILGSIDYDAGVGLNKLPFHPGHSTAAKFERQISTHLQAYEWAVIQDHLLGKAVLATLPSVTGHRRRDLLQLLNSSATAGKTAFKLNQAFASDFSHEQYKDAYNTIQAYIQAGDCYQVNLAQHFTAPFEGDPWHAYKILREIAAAPFSAYLARPDGSTVMSLSPERFVSLHGQHVETSPIKGTSPRNKDPVVDERSATALRNSEKDRAENLMIVDLLRNDLGRSCVPGSIHVDRLFELQSFPTVHHLVSTISGELTPLRNAWDLLCDSFPGGSITGAPKRRAMEIIAELESHPRQAYCGSVLYVSADGRMDSNIAIRTLLCEDDEIHCWGGGGIVADSQCDQEYQETFDKVGRFLEVLENMGH